MKTYQDLLQVPQNDESIMNFIRSLIGGYRSSDMYVTAITAKDYFDHKNTTIAKYQKLLYTVTGQAVPDNFSANWKMASNFFYRFQTQENQHLLGNGATWEDESVEKKLGKDFNIKLQDIGEAALWGGVAYGFFNLDHLEVFDALEFAPIYDEEDGALKAGVRFWQVADNKPLRATLYELDGYTEFIWRKEKGEVLKPKRSYITHIVSTQADGSRIYDFENYPTFPIIPLWANKSHLSPFIGMREQIDCYDLIKSGFANDVDDASLIYWTIQNAGGMDDVDLAQFVERMKTLHAASLTDDGAQAESHTMEVPYASREALLDRLEKDLYKDAMALNTENIASGAVTATQILASYEPLNSKCDSFEYCVQQFLDGLLKVAGIDHQHPTFTRSVIINKSEEVASTIQAAQFLPDEYVTKRILTIFGDGAKAENIISQMYDEEMSRFNGSNSPENADNDDDEVNSTAKDESGQNEPIRGYKKDE
jgi:hypothetical protein